MEKISKYQLAAMVILFEIGSTPMFELGIKAKQDAWLVVLTGMLAALILVMLFLSIQRMEPGLHLYQMFIRYFGKILGIAAGALYVIFFLYESMRNVRDFGDLSIMTFLSRTPLSLIMLIIVLLSAYAVAMGIEVFFRVAEFMVPGVLLFYALVIVMFFSSGIVHLDKLLPILENGVMPVIKSVYHDTIWFPFGQMVIFLVFWSFMADQSVMTKTTVSVYFVSGTLLIVTNMINIAVLGVSYTQISTIPLLQSVQLIQIANILERFDAFVVLLLYTGFFMKATLWYLAAAVGLGFLLNINYKKLILPLGGIIYIASFLEPNWTYHLWFGKFAAYNLTVNPTFILILPLILYLVMRVKRRKTSTDTASNTTGQEKIT